MNSTLKSVAMSMVAGMVVAGPIVAPFATIADASPIVSRSPLGLNFDSGDVIPVTLDETVTSQYAHTGDKFTATVDSSQAGYHRLRGASITGHVVDVRHSEGRRPGRLSVQFDKLTTRSGQSYDITGSLISLNDKSLKTNDDGVLVAKNTEKKKTLQYAEIGAGAGTVLGILGGGGIRVGTILLGGALGAAAGQLSPGKKESHDVVLKSGTKLGVRLDHALNYPNY